METKNINTTQNGLEFKVRFKDLNAWLKTGIVFAWISGITFIIYFLIGFIGAIILQINGG